MLTDILDLCGFCRSSVYLPPLLPRKAPQLCLENCSNSLVPSGVLVGLFLKAVTLGMGVRSSLLGR